MPPAILLALGAALAAPASATQPLRITTRILAERHVGAPDGTVRTVTAAKGRHAPGDRLVVELAYRNTGQRPIADLVLADPVPAALAYRGAVEGSPPPELSVDGARFAPLAALVVALPGGGTRPAGPDDVVAVRWRLPGALAAGAGGSLSFRAVLR